MASRIFKKKRKLFRGRKSRIPLHKIPDGQIEQQLGRAVVKHAPTAKGNLFDVPEVKKWYRESTRRSDAEIRRQNRKYGIGE